MIGNGWRADFFLRIAAALPDQFEVIGGYTRDEKKAQELTQRCHIAYGTDLDALLDQKPDFVVLSVKRGITSGYLSKLLERKIPILCETPPAETVEDLVQLYQQIQASGVPVQFVEQYPFQPLYAAYQQVIDRGLLGEVQSIYLSALHGYHAASIIRRFLGNPAGPVRIQGQMFEERAVVTRDRYDDILTGEVQTYQREHALLTFANGQHACNDFSLLQYSSYIRCRTMVVRGTHGEIEGLNVRYLNRDHQPIWQQLQRMEHGRYDNKHYALKSLMLGETELYRNPFPYMRWNDDEIATAMCMVKMGELLEGGPEFYPAQEACQDAYLSIMMTQAAQSGRTVITEKQIWE